jgi:hypothetical protein
MRNYGSVGRPNMLLEAYEDWREDRQNQITEAETQGLELREADTRFDFPEFLYGPMRTSTYDGYEEVEGNYRTYARVESMPDFKERRIRGLGGMSKPGYIGEHGEAPPMTRKERPAASLVVDTYGGTYSMTRHLIINDESNELLNTAPREMGRSAAEFIVETIIAFIESNPNAPDGNPVWSVGRGNQGTALFSEDSLAAAASALTRQRDPGSGRRIRITPKVLVLGDPKWELVADRVFNSTETGTRTASQTATDVFDKGTRNPLAQSNIVRQLGTPIFDAYLSDQNDWYLFGDPARIPTFAIGFLNGKEEPQIYLKNPELRQIMGGGGQDPYDMEIRSMHWYVEFDFGVAVIDPLGTYRSTPA